MLALEDLLVANLAVRAGKAQADALRALLTELDAAPARLSLPRVLHERGQLGIEDAKTLLETARRRMRQLYEEAYVAHARAQGVAAPILDQALQEQAREGYMRPLGDKLIERGAVARPVHDAIAREATRAFGAHEAQVLATNRSGGYVQTLGPPASLTGSSRQRPSSMGEVSASGVTPRPATGSAQTATATPPTPLARTQPQQPQASPLMGVGRVNIQGGPPARTPTPPSGAGPISRSTSSSGVHGPPPGPGAQRAPSASGLHGRPPTGQGPRPTSASGVHLVPPPPPPPPPPTALEDGEVTLTLKNPARPFEEQLEQPFDPGRTMGFLDTLDTPDDPEVTISLPAGGVAKGPGLGSLPVLTVSPPSGPGDADRTITLSAGSVPQGPSAFGLSASQEINDPFQTIGMRAGSSTVMQQVAPRPAANDDTTMNVSEAIRQAQAVPTSIHGKYQVIRELGRGNMGVVYLAKDPQRDELVAVKLVQGPQNDEARGRFKREILVSKRLQHDNVIGVFDAGEQPDGSSYMVMEFLEGRSLRTLVQSAAPFPVARCLDLTEQLLSGLAAVHQSQIVHRDIKPDNVQVLDRQGGDFVKIMDFGISRFLGQDTSDEQVFVTMRGTLSGTPAYVAPEAVLEPEVVRPSHDIYALGVTLYEMLTGQLPFPPSRNLRDLLSDTLHAKPRPLAEACPKGAPYPPAVEELVQKLLEKEPESRPASATEALELLAKARRKLEGKDDELPSGKKKRSSAVPRPAAKKEGLTARIARAITGLFRRSK